MLDFKKLCLVYLNATKMSLDNLPVKDIEAYFVENDAPQLELVLFKSDPPIWLFPYSLFLSDYAYSKGDIISAKKYNKIYQSFYPDSPLAQLEGQGLAKQ